MAIAGRIKRGDKLDTSGQQQKNQKKSPPPCPMSSLGPYHSITIAALCRITVASLSAGLPFQRHSRRSLLARNLLSWHVAGN